MQPSTIRTVKPAKLEAGILAALWGLSLLLPVMAMGPAKQNVFPGWGILMIGWLGVLVFQFGWYANLAFLASIGLLLSSKRRTAWVLTAPAALMILTADALTWREMYGDNGSGPIQSFAAGYYVWIAVMIGTAATLTWRYARYMRTRR